SAAQRASRATPAPDTLAQRPSSFGAATPRRWPARRLAALSCLLSLWTLNVQAQQIHLVSSPGKFYVDDKAGNGIVYNYAAYLISNNTAATLPSVYVAITNIVST